MCVCHFSRFVRRDLMERVRQIVNQQKLRCLDGFSTVNDDQKETSTTDKCRFDAKARVLKRLHGTSPTNPCIRRVCAKNACSQQVGSQINTVPNNVHAWRKGKEIIQKYLSTSSESIDKHVVSEEKCSKLEHTSPLEFDSVITKDNQRVLNLNQKEPKNTRNLDKANEKIMKAPFVASKCSKGLFHPVKAKTTVNNSDALVSAQKDIHDCPTPRAHLKALVQQQREARKRNLKRQLEAEKEKRERIQRNLQATALAAAAAAKSSVTQTKRISEFSPVVPVCSFQPIKMPVLPLNSYSSERERKLEELLRRETSTPENQTTAPASSDQDSMHSSYRDFIETFKVRSSSVNSHLTNPVSTSECSMKQNLMASVNKSGDVNSYESELSKRSLHEDQKLTVPVSFENAVSTGSRADVIVTRPEIRQNCLFALKKSADSCANRPKNICDHATEAARLGIKLSTQRIKHMLVVDSDDDDDDNNSVEDHCFYTKGVVNSSVSSSGTIQKPTVGVWRRLEAVGASESELEDNNVCIIEDVKDEQPSTVDHVSKHLPSSWKYQTNLNNFHQAGINHFTRDICAKDEFRNLIYSDPLRFAWVHKHQKKLFDRGEKKPFQSFETQVNNMAKIGAREKNNTDRNSSACSREVNGKELLAVKSNASGDINTQAVHVGCTNSGDHSSLSHNTCPIRTKAQELFITEDHSDSQTLPANYQNINTFINKNINSSQPRLTPAALNLQLAAEMNYLEALSGSMQHIANMESLRQITAAQAECVSLAQLLKARELQISSNIGDQILEKEGPGAFVSSDEPGRLISGVHSPQFESVLKAAEEFDKIERRLSVRTSHLDSNSYCSAKSPSVNSNISNEASVQKSLNGSISVTVSCKDMLSVSSANRRQFSAESDKTLSNDDVIKSISGGVVTASDSSNEPYRPFSNGDAVASMTRIDKTSEPGKLTIVSSSSSSSKSNNSNVEKQKERKKNVAINSNNDKKAMKSSGQLINDDLHKNSNDQVLTRRKKLKRHSRNEKPCTKSIDIPILNLNVISPNSSCQTERNEKFNQVKYVLNKRVAALQSRRKKAEELLALAKNIELEEVEVVRLEREALNAIQNKHLALSNDNESKKCSRSSRWSKNNDSQHWRSNSHSPVNQCSNYSQSSDELGIEEPHNEKTNSEQFSTSSLGKSASLLRCNRTNSNTTSECSTAQRLSIATDLKYRKSDSDSNRSASHSEKHHSNTAAGNNYKFIPDRYTEKCTSNLLITENDVNFSQVSKVSNHCFPKLDIGVETTPSLHNLLICETGTPSLDRTVTPTSRQLRQRSNSHDSGRRRRVTVPNSVDSMDEDCRLFSVGDDEPFSTVSANSHSDLSELESRIQALNFNLKKQESVLCRINTEYKRVHKDHLARLESTLLKHRQLCTKIIANIKSDLDVCRASTCTEANNSHSNSTKKVVDTHNISHISPSKSLNKTTLDNYNDNSISCASSKHIDKLASSSQMLTSKHSENDDETELDTLISVAEELVSPQDTDDELKQLDLDDDIDRCTPVTDHSPNSTNKNITYLSNADVSVAGSKQTMNSENSQSKRSLSPPTHTESSYGTDFQPSSEDYSSKPLNNQNILNKNEIGKDFSNTSMNFTNNSSEKTVMGHVNQIDNAFSNQLTRKNLIDECLTVLNVGVARHQYESNNILSRSSSAPVIEFDHVTDEKVSTVITEDFNNMAVSTDVQMPCGDMSLLKIAADHQQREELVDRITTELLNQLVAEAIDSTLNVRKSNLKIKSPDNSESDDDDDLLDDEFNQKSSASQSSSEDSMPLLDLGLKTCDDYEEKSPETFKSKMSFTPELSFTVDNIVGLFADTPDRTKPLIHLAVKHFWDARLNATNECEEIVLLKASNNPPLEFAVDYYDEADLELFRTQSNVRFINRALLFDLISEIVQKIYIGEVNEVELQERLISNANPPESKTPSRVSSSRFQLWRGPCPPTTYDRLLTIVTAEVCRELNLRMVSKSEICNHNSSNTKRFGLNEMVPSGVRLSRLVQWTLSKKSWLDRILELELRADEPSWLSYVPEEREIKMKLANEIWEDVLDNALTSILASNARHLSK
ncbi:unnamed protein product [Schistosoma turkestanicum]|nr:unnamed protein product [Schistosoma turkestanicum]